MKVISALLGALALHKTQAKLVGDAEALRVLTGDKKCNTWAVDKGKCDYCCDDNHKKVDPIDEITFIYLPDDWKYSEYQSDKATCNDPNKKGKYPDPAKIIVDTGYSIQKFDYVTSGQPFTVKGPFKAYTYFTFEKISNGRALGWRKGNMHKKKRNRNKQKQNKRNPKPNMPKPTMPKPKPNMKPGKPPRKPHVPVECDIHTSCSVPLVGGDQIGPIKIKDLPDCDLCCDVSADPGDSAEVDMSDKECITVDFMYDYICDGSEFPPDRHDYVGFVPCDQVDKVADGPGDPIKMFAWTCYGDGSPGGMNYPTCQTSPVSIPQGSLTLCKKTLPAYTNSASYGWPAKGSGCYTLFYGNDGTGKFGQSGGNIEYCYDWGVNYIF